MIIKDSKGTEQKPPRQSRFFKSIRQKKKTIIVALADNSNES